MPFAERMRKANPYIYIYICIYVYIHASSAAASASSVASASASASLAWGFYSWSIAICRLQKKVSNSSFSTTSANMCNPCFSTYPGATSHDMWYNAIILGIYTVCFTKMFSSGTAKTHLICSSLLLSWCFSFCNIVRSGLLATELTAQMLSYLS